VRPHPDEGRAGVLSQLLEDEVVHETAASAVVARSREAFDAKVADRELVRFLDSMRHAKP
jgi:hypothetical protein